MTIVINKIPVNPDNPYPLGRHQEHDERSWNYMALPKAAMPTNKSSFFGSKAKVLNQGDLGSCTGNATAQLLNTSWADKARAKKLGSIGKYLSEANAVTFYSRATVLDNIAGQYPPTDTGSSGIGVAKAAVALGWCASYSWLMSWTSLLAQVERTPVIVGTAWTNAMFKPINGLVKVGSLTQANIAGGHEYLCCGVDYDSNCLVFRNSWGDSNFWPGCLPGGYFHIGFKDFQKLQGAGADVTVLNPVGM